MTDTQPQPSKSRPVLVMSSVLAAYTVFVGGLGALDVVDVKVVGLLGLLGGAVTVGWGLYTQSVTTPWQDVVAKATPNGLVVAGPASHAVTGREVVVTEQLTGEVVAPPPVEPGDQ